MKFEIDYFWSSKGLVSFHVSTAKNFFMDLHIIPEPSAWLWGRNSYWKNQPVVDFGVGPLLRLVCVQL